MLRKTIVLDLSTAFGELFSVRSFVLAIRREASTLIFSDLMKAFKLAYQEVKLIRTVLGLGITFGYLYWYGM